MVTSPTTSTLTPLQLATAWPDVQPRQWSEPAAPVWTGPAAPVWSKPAVWTEPATWAPVPTITSYSWTDAISYSYTTTTLATATPSPSYSYEETHRPAVSSASTIKGTIIGVSVTGSVLLAIFAYTVIRRYIYRRQPKNNQDSDVEMAASLPSNPPPPARSAQTPQAPAARVPAVHSFVKDGFHATPVQGRYFVQTMPSRKPVPAHGSSLPPHLQPTHWPTGRIDNVTWTRGRGYLQMV
jgi:hypothetical protein